MRERHGRRTDKGIVNVGILLHKRNASINRMPKSKNRNARKKRSSKEAKIAEEDDIDDIELQLRRQREKQKKSGQKPHQVNEETDEKSTKQRLGNYEYCRKRKAYFPAGYIAKEESKGDDRTLNNERHLLSARNILQITHPCQPLTPIFTELAQGISIPAPTLAYAACICSKPLRRRKLVAHLRGTLLLESMINTPNAIDYVDGTPSRRQHRWAFLSDSSPTSLQRDRPLRSDARNGFPTWSRTFDIITGTHALDQPSTAEGFPGIITITKNDVIIRGRSGHKMTNGQRLDCISHGPDLRSDNPEDLTSVPSVSHCRPHMVRVFDDPCLMVTVDSYRESQSRFVISSFRSSSLTTIETIRWQRDGHFPYTANDVAFDGHGLVVAYDRRTTIRFNGEDFSSWTMERSEPDCPTGKSDALCIECPRVAVSILGHRDGQISLRDSREEWRFAKLRKSSKLFDSQSVVRLKPLSCNEHTLLARGSSGTCQLFDLRKFGTYSRQTRKNHSSPSIQEFQLPSNIDSLLTSKCNGIAVDPSESVLMSPYVDSSHRARLGVWSLYSGEFVGSKSLSGVAEKENATPTVELCEKVTAAWQWRRQKLSDAPVLDKAGGAVGLWYKLTQHQPPTENTPPIRAGNIHHVIFLGRRDSVSEGI